MFISFNEHKLHISIIHQFEIKAQGMQYVDDVVLSPSICKSEFI